MDMMWYRRRGLMVTPHIESVTGAIASFNSDYNKIPIKSLICDIEPIQEGTGDPSPDNVRPISGRTGLSVVRAGVNAWNEEWEKGAYNITTGTPTTNNQQIRTKKPIIVKPNTSYYINVPRESGQITSGFAIILYYDAMGTFLSYNQVQSEGVVITTPDNAHQMTFFVSSIYGNTYLNNISINYPATDTHYHAYSGETYGITFPSEVGIVYGGILDVTNSELVVDKAIVTFDGSSDESWIVVSSNRAYTQINAIKKEINYSQSMKCDKLRVVSNHVTVSNTDYSISGYGDYGGNYPNQNWVYLKVTDAYNTVASIREWLTANPVTIVYPLATPITYTLLLQEVRALLGENNIWSDSGDVTVDYWKWGK